MRDADQDEARSESADERRSRRSPVLWIAEIARFPRDAAAGGPSSGFALDESESGLCLQIDAPARAGALLRVTLRDLDGTARREEIVRVIWCRPREGGRYNAGLEVLGRGEGRPLCVQHAQRRMRVEVEPKD